MVACLDMYGCPNRCKHCWLGVTQNGNLNIDDLKFVAKEFRPFTDNFEIFDWYREPDYKDNYKELWQLTSELSDTKTPHFELISFWRAVRDDTYVKWVASLGVKTAQLTIFGDETTTDFYIGRKGAYKEIIQTIDILFKNGIAPRIQTFVNKRNISKLPHIQNLIETLELEKRCNDIGQEFVFFIHQGSCDGENEQFYDEWVTSEDIEKIPQKLIDLTIKGNGRSNIIRNFGKTESELYDQLIVDTSTENIVSESPVFYIDKNFNVYPNYATPSRFWSLGNLRYEGIKTILENYMDNKSAAQKIKLTIPICEMAKKYGNPDSTRLFGEGDYKNYLLHLYCRSL